MRPRRLLFALVPAIILYTALEIAGRALVRRAPSEAGTGNALAFDAETGWALPKSAHFTWMGVPATTNRLGLRSHNPWKPGTRPEPVLRILALGDSSVFGHGVADDETFPTVLEALIEDQQPADVQNGGVPGFTCPQSRRLYHRVLHDFSPEILIVYNVHSDRRIASTEDLMFPGAAVPLVGDLGAYRLASALAFKLRVRWGGAGSSLASYTECLRDLVSDQERRKGKVIFAIAPADADFPGQGRSWGPEPGPAGTHLTDYREAMAAVASSTNSLLVNLPAALQQTGLPRDLLLMDAVHPGAQGHVIIAQTLAASLQQAGMITPLVP